MNNQNKNYTGIKVSGVMDILLGLILCGVGFYGLDELSDRLFKSSEAEMYSNLAIIFGVLCILGGIITIAVASSQEKKQLNDMYNNINHMYQHRVYESQITDHKICPKCDQPNDNSAKYCRFCNSSLDNSRTVKTGPNCWVCPNCGTINQNYVGTCGCGEVRP